jgi:membrane-associated HD superfamily phosphohydrolase
MNNSIQKNILYTGLIVLGMTMSSLALASSDSQKVDKSNAVTSIQDQVNEDAVKNRVDVQNHLLETIDAGVREGFQKVTEASQLISEGKDKEAIKSLEEAVGKFDIALAADPALGLIPIESSVKVSQLIIKPETVEAYTSTAIDYLEQSKLQAARALLMPLRDDMLTRTVYLPMTTYPDAIKLATKLLIKGDRDAAVDTIATAFSTLVEKASVVPLPLVRVEAMVLAASKLDKEKNKEQAKELLEASEEQLNLAVALGYTDEDSDLYEDLQDQVKKLKREINGGNVVQRLYKKLNASIKSLMSKSSKQTEVIDK